MKHFHDQIKTALANPVLQAALDTNADNRRRARERAYLSLPEPFEVLRQRAHEVRSETIKNLPGYLDQFIKKVQENGIVVHRAEDASQARQIVLEVAREHNAQLIAKSKTMVSEEIELNDALEAVGIRPVETDLGEYIVQLRGEPPAHITTPAVHLRRQEVAETFHEKLEIPYTEDIPTLTDAARLELRQTFLDADIGLSGVNFGVVETGSLCIVTNEGNGRMVTTVPPVHIALMGMERLVPTLDDLALMLALLPRSSTGQKITVYTQLIHAPRREGEVDGSQERHLIILDNDRANMLGSDLEGSLMCIRCGTCLNACPVFRELGGHSYVGHTGQGTPYPGPIGSVISPGLFGINDFGHLAQASTLCGACKDSCPVDIDLPGMLLRIRSGVSVPSENQRVETTKKVGIGLPGHVSLGLKLYTWAAVNPRRFGLTQKLAAIFSNLLSPNKEWMRLPEITGWGYSKDFPRPAMKTFRERFTFQRRDAESAEKKLGEPGQTNSQTAQSNSLNTINPVSQFEQELTAIGGSFTICPLDSLADEILSVLQPQGISEILAWEQEYLPAGLVENLREQGINISHTPHAKFQAGLTGALAAVADTGTLVLTSGSGRPKSISLLPQMHIAIIHKKDIYENLPQVLNLREIREASSVTLISGPSRTADIEMTLTIGVHGPGELHVLCYE